MRIIKTIIPALLSYAEMAAGIYAVAGNSQAPVIINESFADDSGFKKFNINPK